MPRLNAIIKHSLILAGSGKHSDCHLPYLTAFASHIINSSDRRRIDLYAASLIAMIGELAIANPCMERLSIRSFEVPFLIDLIAEYVSSGSIAEGLFEGLRNSYPNSLPLEVNWLALQSAHGNWLEYVVEDSGDDFTWRQIGFSDQLVIGFSGASHRAQGLSWSLFQRAICPVVESDLLILRDYSVLGYVNGVASLGSLEKTIERVAAIASRYKRIVFLGCSMGSYGALLISSQIGIDSRLVLLAGQGPLEVCPSSSGGLLAATVCWSSHALHR